MMKETRQLRKRVTLKDIARETGYAANTISKALRDAPDLAEETKAQIRAVADEMGYIVNSSANSLRSGLTHTIALIVADITNPLFAIIAKEIEAVAQGVNYTVVIMNTEEDIAREKSAVRAAIEKNVDGVLLFQTQISQEPADLLERVGIPCVLLCRVFDGQNLDAVCIDEVSGGYLAGKCLLSRGRRHIVMLNAPMRISCSWQRQEGFEKAMRECSDPVDYEILHVDSALGGCRELLDRLYARGEAPDGLFCFSDMFAFETICALKERGIRVPEDVSIIGYDNIQSKLPIPFPLTTIFVHKSELARDAVNLLLRRIQGDDDLFPERLVLPVQLTDRGSV